jgi:hypothetical protein
VKELFCQGTRNIKEMDLQKVLAIDTTSVPYTAALFEVSTEYVELVEFYTVNSQSPEASSFNVEESSVPFDKNDQAQSNVAGANSKTPDELTQILSVENYFDVSVLILNPKNTVTLNVTLQGFYSATASGALKKTLFSLPKSGKSDFANTIYYQVLDTVPFELDDSLIINTPLSDPKLSAQSDASEKKIPQQKDKEILASVYDKKQIEASIDFAHSIGIEPYIITTPASLVFTLINAYDKDLAERRIETTQATSVNDILVYTKDYIETQKSSEEINDIAASNDKNIASGNAPYVTTTPTVEELCQHYVIATIQSDSLYILAVINGKLAGQRSIEAQFLNNDYLLDTILFEIKRTILFFEKKHSLAFQRVYTLLQPLDQNAASFIGKEIINLSMETLLGNSVTVSSINVDLISQSNVLKTNWKGDQNLNNSETNTVHSPDRSSSQTTTKEDQDLQSYPVSSQTGYKEKNTTHGEAEELTLSLLSALVLTKFPEDNTLNLRQGEFKCNPKLQEILRGFIALLPFLISFFLIIFLTVGSLYLMRDAKVRYLNKVVAQTIESKLPEISKKAQPGQELEALIQENQKNDKQLKELAAASQISPLEVLHDLAALLNSLPQEVTLKKFLVENDVTKFEVTAPDFPTVEKIDKLLKKHRDVFCRPIDRKLNNSTTFNQSGKRDIRYTWKLCPREMNTK